MPPHWHMHDDVLVRAGKAPIRTCMAPGTHGANVTGIQGIGVSTPSAAAVAEVTVGFDIDIHMPNGNIFASGIWSIIVAAGVVLITRLAGVTIKLPGAEPKLQEREAPAQTICPIVITLTKLNLQMRYS